MQVLSQYSERSSCLEVGGTLATAMGLLSCGSKLIGFRLRAAATSRHDANWGDNKPISSAFVKEWVCECVCEYFSHVRFCWTTGISNLITPPAPDLRSLGRRAGGAANCYLQHLKQHTITLLFHFSFGLTLATRLSNLGSVAREEPVGTIWSILLLPRVIMQVLPFYDFLWAFYTELQRVFVDVAKTVVLSNVKKDAWCAHSIESFVREITRSRGQFSESFHCAKWSPQ